MRNFHIQECYFIKNQNVHLIENVYLFTTDLESIAIDEITVFKSKRLIVGFKQGDTINCYVYVTHSITENNNKCLVTFLKDNQSVKFYYFIDNNLEVLENFEKYTVLKNNTLCFPRS